jgi:hypothetical protein
VAKAEENLIAYSQEFDNAAWSKVRTTVTANATTAPDGTSTADALFETAVGSSHLIQLSPARFATVAGQLVVSVFAKPNGRDWIRLNGDTIGGTNGFGEVFFDVTNGVVGTSSSGNGWSISSSAIASVGNGWYRCSVVINTTARTDAGWTVFLASADGTTAYTGDITKGVYLWGAQAEVRSSLTAYTATTTAPITNYIPALQTAASGVARFEHNPVTGESLGLEIEGQRTNLALRSEDFADAVWTAFGTKTVTSNVLVAPDGTITADYLASPSNNGMQQSISISASTAYTFTVFAKAGVGTDIRLSYATSGGTAVNGSSDFTISTGVAVGNGWFRHSLTFTTSVGNTQVVVRVQSAPTAQGIYIWGAQLEAGSFATSYIPTVASQVTRSQDLAVMTGTNFSSWFNVQEGSVYTEVQVPFTASYTIRLFAIDDGTANNILQGQYSLGTNGTMTFALDTGASNRFALSRNNAAFGSTHKFTGAYRSGDSILGVDGTNTSASTSTWASFNPSVLRIGSATGGGQQPNGTIRKFAFYPKRLTNAELQGLTTV